MKRLFTALIPLSLLAAFNTAVFAHAVIIPAKDFLAIKIILFNISEYGLCAYSYNRKN